MAGEQDRKTALWQPMVATLIVLLATGLRFYQLDTQSFWNDEGNTARLVERTVDLIIEGAAGDIHPPGYYLLLHGWRALVGYSEFALRSYSALCGILSVAVAISLGKLAGGRWSGLVAGAFAAVHPLAITYGQEARMYAQLGLVAALTLRAAAAVVRARRRPTQWQSVLGLALCVALGLYTQYTYILALVGLNLAFAVTWLVERGRQDRAEPAERPTSHRRTVGDIGLLTRWALAHALGGALFLPWAPIAMRAAGWQPPDLNQGDAAVALLRTLSAGIVPQEPVRGAATVGGMLTLAGLAALMLSGRRRHSFVRWAACGMAIVPPAIIAAAGIYRPAYLKFLMMSVVPLTVTWALPFGRSFSLHTPGLHRAKTAPWLLPVLATLPALALVVIQARALDHIYHDPALARDDYRALATEIRERGRPGDGIVLDAPNQWEVFTYYYGAQPGDVLPVHPAPYRPTEAEATTWVADVVSRHTDGRLFVLYWGDGESDPGRYLERALATQAFKAGERWVTTIRLAEYGVAAPQDVSTAPLDARLGDGIVLASYGLPAGPYSPGTIVPLQVQWETEGNIEQRLKVFVHLVNGEGTLKAQVDTEPQGGFAPTSIWGPGDEVTDRYGLALPPDLASGDYAILIGMYTLDGIRLPITQNGAPQGDALRLSEIVVAVRD